MLRWGLLVFGVSFAASLLSSAGCAAFGGSGGCNCPPPSEHPPAQAPITGLDISSYGTDGNEVSTEVQPETGSIEVTPDHVVIRYQQDNIDHEVRYAVTGPL